MLDCHGGVVEIGQVGSDSRVGESGKAMKERPSWSRRRGAALI